MHTQWESLANEHILGIASVSQSDGHRMLILTDIDALMAEADMGLLAEAA